MASWDGLGSAPQKHDLQMPNPFQSVDQPQPGAASSFPLLVVERTLLYVEIPAVQSQQQSPSVGNAKKKKVHIYAYTS